MLPRLTSPPGGTTVIRMSTETNRYLSPREVVEYMAERGVRVTEDRVRAWLRDQGVPSITLPGGHRRMVALSTVDAILRGDYGDHTETTETK